MARTPATHSDHPPLRRRSHAVAWLAGRWPAGRPGLLLAGVLLVVGGVFALVVTVGALEQHRRMLASADSRESPRLEAEAAVVGLALDVGRVPPGLAAGAQVAVLDTGAGGRAGVPLVGEARVTAVSALPGTDSASVRVGLEVPGDAVGVVAAAGAEDRVVLAALPMA